MDNKQLNGIPLESGKQVIDVINFLPDATFVIDDRKCVLVWNRAMEELSGVKAEDMIGKCDHEYALPFYGERRPVLIDLVSEPPEVIARSYPDYRKKGDTFYSEVFVPSLGTEGAHLWAVAKPLFDSEGKAIGAIESLRDITEQKRAEQTIRSQKQELESVNRELSSSIELVRSANREYEDANKRLALAQEDLLKTNEMLRASEEKFSTAFRLCPFVLTLSTASEGRYVEVSDLFYTLTGYAKGEVVGHTAFDLNIWVNQEDRTRIMDGLKEQGRIINEEIQFRAKGGNVRTMLFSAEIVQIVKIPYLLTVNVDITERKQSEKTIRSQKKELERVNEELKGMIQKIEGANDQLTQAQEDLVAANRRLRISEEKFSKAFHLGPIILTLSSLKDSSYVEVSDFFLKTTEYTREEVIGHSSLELNIWVNPEDRKRVLKRLETSGIVQDEEIPFRSKSGRIYIMLYFAEIITISDDRHIVSVAVDITERKHAEAEKDKMEKQFFQAQKMESIGKLAGGIAHDFNNLLTAILGNIELSMLNLKAESSLYSNLEMAKKAAESAADLTKQLLAFSRKQVIEPKIIDLNEMIDHMKKMLGRLIGEDVNLHTSPKARPGFIKADPGHIEQIIINLAVNARDAMPNGGRLVLETSDVNLDEFYCRDHVEALPGEYVMLSVSDSGTGMSDDVRKHLFEPFFTTKPKGKGTGLGLAMVYGAVKQNKGVIEVYSVPGEGTTFKIYFPRTAEEGPALSIDIPADRDLTGKETILLVEDDFMVRDFAIKLLGRFGYTVFHATSAEGALSFEESFSGGIDLLITDVILPGISGKALANEIEKRRPGTRVLFTSGYSENFIAHHGVFETTINFIGKPYSANSLMKKIREVIDKS